jgi:alanine racemase
LRLASLYTHFPDADAADIAFAEDQIRRFRDLARGSPPGQSVRRGSMRRTAPAH